MKVNINTQPLVAQQLPNTYTVEIEGVEYTVENYPALTHLHYEHGWRYVIIPEYNSATHKLGELIYDEVNDVGTYEVIEKTQQEIEAEITAQAKIAQEEALKAIQDSKILSEIQEFEDEDALQNQSAYPLWEADVYVAFGEKRQDLDANNELKLFKCVQAHTTQSDWRPKDTPALWVEVAPPGVIPVWVQPQGAHDAYQIDDLVHFPTAEDEVYRNTVANNVYAPDVYGWVLNS